MLRLLLIALTLITCSTLSSCGQNSATSEATIMLQGLTSPEPAYFEALLLSPSQWRAVSQPDDDDDLIGIDDDGFTEPSNNVAADGDDEVYSPDSGEQGLSSWAYGTYNHQVEDDKLSKVDVTTEPVWQGDAPDDAYVGVADWSRDRWWFRRVDPGRPATSLLVEGMVYSDIVHPVGGNMMIVVFCHGEGSYTLTDLEFANPPWQYWTHTWGTWDYDYVADLACDTQGNMYLCGETFAGGSMDLLLLKCSPEGELEWASMCGTDGWETARDVCFYDDALWVCGGIRPDGEDYYDFLMQKWGLDGALLASYSWGGTEDEIAEAIHAGAQGLYLGGYTYEVPEPEYDDCDNVIIKVDLEFSSVELVHQWGTRNWESVKALCAPPDLAAQDYICAAEIANDDFNFLGDSSIAMSVWSSEGCEKRRGLELDNTKSAEVKCATSGPGSYVYAGGWAQADEVDSVPVKLVYKFDSSTVVTPPETVVWARMWIPRAPYRADISAMTFVDDQLFAVGNVGQSNWPDVEWWPTLFVITDSTFPALGAAWGDGNPDNQATGIGQLPSGNIAVAGTGGNAYERWHATLGTVIDIGITVWDLGLDFNTEDHPLLERAMTLVDMCSTIEPSEDDGAGLMDVLLESVTCSVVL